MHIVIPAKAGIHRSGVYLVREIPQKSYGFSGISIVLSVYCNEKISKGCLADIGTRPKISGSNDLNLKE